MNKRAKDRLSLAPEAAMLVISMLLVFAVGALSYINLGQVKTTSEQLAITRGIAKLNQELLSALKDAETGQRGYLLTGREELLNSYTHAVVEVPSLLKQLKSLTQTRADQRARVMAMEPLVTARLAELKQTVDLRRAHNLEEALALVNTDRGRTIMDELRTYSSAIDQAANERQARFAALSDQSTSRLRTVSTLGSLLLLGFLLISALTIYRAIERREDLFSQCYENEKRLSITLASIADGVISTDAEARIVLVNPVAEQLIGCRQQGCLGRHISDVFHMVNETTRDKVSNPLERAISEGRAVGLTNHTKLIAQDGTEISIDDSAAPIRNEHGKIVGAVLIFRDITEKRESERELAEAAQALQKSNEELQHFAFAASHDLRSPLNSVNVIAQLLAKRFSDKLGPDGAEMIGCITDGVSRMVRLIEDLLALAKAGDISRDAVELSSMQEAFNIACHNVQAELQSTKASIVCSPLPVVAARETHLVQVFQNILNNALKYRGSMPPRIQVSASHSGSEWIISVTDNGIGIEPQYSEQIFQPFKRLHGHQYEGSGIGLSTCKKIVSGYGGRIWVESEVGKGSTFYFSLPASQGVAVSAGNGQKA